MKKESVLNSPRLSELRKKKQRKIKFRMKIILIVLVVLILGLSIASRIPAFNIDKVSITGNKIIETRLIDEVIQKEISGNYLWIFPKTNFLIYPKNKIATELKNNFNRIKTVFINDKNIKTLEISVSEYGGKYLWCGNIIPVPESNTNDSKCYFLDENGYIFDEAPFFSGDVYFKFYGNTGFDGSNPLGSYFLKDQFVKIIEFRDTLEKLNLKPTAFIIQEDSQHNTEASFSIKSEPGKGPKIIFKVTSDFQKMSENLQAAIFTEPLKSKLRDSLDSLLYIDLRFGNKVYYKFQ